MTAPIPPGFHTITPTLVLEDARKAIDLYKAAFEAKEEYCMKSPKTGKIMHACLQIGTSKLFLMDEMPEMGCMATSAGAQFYLYLPDADSAFKQARSAGLEEKFKPEDQFWGDRTACVTDPFGVVWTLATHVHDVSQDEMDEAVRKMSEAA